jgi:hypothetical protein
MYLLFLGHLGPKKSRFSGPYTSRFIYVNNKYVHVQYINNYVNIPKDARERVYHTIQKMIRKEQVL